ncbi:hypothetical protein IMG5_086710 [Ichthyophthirius multifiliis]|uniref:Serine aminopeptidase S33 domain-containing protein n=1 Tax=Ichthyophthirius multifiliis TaxID=5932 RepID=G0QR06_ICHMU|nr:hypothetical protein IMG5_086710 [Ichthyophthirius multifiliis]EGR32351.1 hypothetical protein IMG5_086710 [Ichthyophthirius multifiliis]|eukprot:XP_004035837.1 hypothetical protein IMG5_086710 [Ichthyophthirius multifiliis]
MLENIQNKYEDIWKSIIRPPRDTYQIEDLGKKYKKQQNQLIKQNKNRQDIDLKNPRGHILKCSYFKSQNQQIQPCVIYLHGNSSSRFESLDCLKVLIPRNISLFSFDFSGCGHSQGKYISLGWYEREDVQTVINYLKQTKKVNQISIWGRSMGAVTSLMYADRDPRISGIVSDSAFSSLKKLAEELCQQNTKIPSFIVSIALQVVKKKIQEEAQFNIFEIDPLNNHIDKIKSPIFFVAGNQDKFISPNHSILLHQKYSNKNKNINFIDADHNSKRPIYILEKIGNFFLQCFILEKKNDLNFYSVIKNDSKQKQQYVQKIKYNNKKNKDNIKNNNNNNSNNNKNNNNNNNIIQQQQLLLLQQ